jgi:hypothetical protein
MGRKNSLNARKPTNSSTSTPATRSRITAKITARDSPYSTAGTPNRRERPAARRRSTS